MENYPQDKTLISFSSLSLCLMCLPIPFIGKFHSVAHSWFKMVATLTLGKDMTFGILLHIVSTKSCLMHFWFESYNTQTQPQCRRTDYNKCHMSLKQLVVDLSEQDSVAVGYSHVCESPSELTHPSSCPMIQSYFLRILDMNKLIVNLMKWLVDLSQSNVTLCQMKVAVCWWRTVHLFQDFLKRNSSLMTVEM